ncbi:glycoside hydrolase family 32 protein [Bacillus alkalisoli]|uniref:glycoside hydrolase family 32 protein n=1 Tax=Bacillus alkalisoli TaxID=2011008 RepID=UPI000C233AB2|nr:sucrose-6-phosphate hydrolase [Bacillus alkalisoli]
MTSKDDALKQQALAEVEKYKELVENDYYRLNYHIMPPVGLLNDPNGFIHWNGTYHLFYQWMPFKTGHGAKFWGHYTSTDLVQWTHEKIALAPSDWFDKNGCYSGCAISHQGELLLFYTGNVKDEEGNRETYQCLAVSKDGIRFEKKGPVVQLPTEAYTAHFRDPKVWKHDDKWYMVVGAQSHELEGKVALLKSENGTDWQHVGAIAGSNLNGLGEFGYMWECPDLFHLDDKDVLIVSPQGLKPEGYKYQNVFQAGYFLGKLEYQEANFEHGEFVELDRGFEFYAPQTTLDENGRRLLIGWMGVPEQQEDKHPTIENRWIHCMTLPRELKMVNDKLIQQPVEELALLRKSKLELQNVYAVDEMLELDGMSGDSYELFVELLENDYSFLEINVRDNVRLIYNREEKRFSMERVNFVTSQTEIRSCSLEELSLLTIYLDTSSIEVFVNGGEEVFTARMFPFESNRAIKVGAKGKLKMNVIKWDI